MDSVESAKLRAILVDTPCEFCGSKKDVWTMIDGAFFTYPSEEAVVVHKPRRVCKACREAGRS